MLTVSLTWSYFKISEAYKTVFFIFTFLFCFLKARDCMAFTEKTSDQLFVLHLVASWLYNF